MVMCGVCGVEVKSLSEDHFHMPDFALDVRNFQARLVWNRKTEDNVVVETLPFNIPSRWVNFVLETCGGAINLSGQYRLPGMVWEWVIAKLRDDRPGVEFLEKKINDFVEKHGF